jgi:cytochrome c2
MFIKRINTGIYLSSLAILSFWLSVIPLNTVAQNGKGKEIFDKTCAVCHNLSTEKKVGPGLLDIGQRRDIEWIKKFVAGSQAMVKSGDKTAIQVFTENGQVPMPDHNYSDEEMTSLISYITTYKPAELKAVTVDISKKNGFELSEIKRGERLFYGLIPFEKGKTLTCVSCHNLVATDSLNFNPSAIDIAIAWKEPNGTNLYRVLGEPVSKKMAEAHEGLQMSDQEIFQVSAFLSEVADTGYTKEKTFPARFLLFLVTGILMALALLDLVWFKRVKYKVIHVLVLLTGITVHSVFAFQEATNLSHTQNYAPDQPIKFSHKVHAGQNKIDCQYCHFNAANSKSAGIPSAGLCMNCHKAVQQGSRSGKFEINKINRAISSGHPIEWIRIHKLPDHVFFSHMQHVVAGKINCQKCHGKVEEMDLLKQQESLSMGWCINCHRTTGVQFTGNKYYDSFKQLHQDLASGKIKKVTVEQVGGIDCSKCHY